MNPTVRPAPGRSLSGAALAVVLATAAVLRFRHLGWGLDQGQFLPDERFLWSSYFFAFLSPSASSLLEHGLIYPPLYGYALGLGTALGHVLGILGPARDPLQAIYVARIVSASAGLVSVLLAGRLASRAYSARAGLIAMALTAVLPFEVLQVRYASSDVLLTTCATATILVSVELAHLAGWWRAALAGVATSLTFATKYTGLAIGIAPAWSVLEVALRERSLRLFARLAAIVLLAFALGVGVSCPPCWLRTERLLAVWSWLRLAHVTHVGPLADLLTTRIGWWGRPYLYQAVAALPFAFGIPMYAAVVAGVGRALRRRTITDRVILVGVGGFLVAIGASPSAFVRYLEPVFPVLAVLAARWLDEVRVRPRVRAALIGAVLAYSLALCLTQLARFSYEQQQGVAGWLAARAPAQQAGALRVSVPRTMLDYFGLEQPLRAAGVRVTPREPGHWLDGAPDAFVLPEWLAIMIRRNDPDLALTQDLERLVSGEAGYVPAARWSSTYLQKAVDVRLDPALTSRLEQGEIGFTIYVRRDPSER